MLRETRSERGVLRRHLGVRRHQQHVVEGERFSRRRMNFAPKNGLYPHRKMAVRQIH